MERIITVMYIYGHNNDVHHRYIWALISGVGIFFLGCGVSMYHGIMQIMHPAPIESLPVALGGYITLITQSNSSHITSHITHITLITHRTSHSSLHIITTSHTHHTSHSTHSSHITIHHTSHIVMHHTSQSNSSHIVIHHTSHSNSLFPSHPPP